MLVLLLCLLVVLIPGSMLAGEFQLIGSPNLIVAVAGDAVILPCFLKPPIEGSLLIFQWSRPDLKPRYVHFYREGQNIEDMQNPSYKNRTMVFERELGKGNVSLKLSRVRLEDEGNYTCQCCAFEHTVIQLNVVLVSKPVVSILGTREDRKVLQCVAEGWYPEPELEWRDSEGLVLPADVTQTDRHPDHGSYQCYTVRSNVTVKKTDTNRFTCTVELQGLNQTREIEIHVPDGMLLPTEGPQLIGNYRTPVITGFIVMLLLVATVLLWRRRRYCCSP